MGKHALGQLALCWGLLGIFPLACSGESSEDPQLGAGGSSGANGGTSGNGGAGALGGSGAVGGSAGMPGGGGGGVDGGLTCAPPMADCDHQLQDGCEVNLSTDPANCGACGVACSAGSVCTKGECVCSCPSGLTECGGCFCTNTQVDPANCGACGVKCPTGSLCANGSCSGVSVACPGAPTLPTVGTEVVTGSPSWTASGWSVYAAPCGTFANNAQEFTQSTIAVWSPLHSLDPVQNTFKCASAHAPPYPIELTNGVMAAGFQSSGCFLQKVWQAPSGIIVSTLLVASAAAPIDLSFETPSTPAPVISFSSLSIDADLYRDGVLIDPYFDSTYPKAAAVYNYQPPFDTANGGYRHLPLNWGENDSLSGGVALTPGNYSFVVKMSDGVNTTSQTISYVIQP